MVPDFMLERCRDIRRLVDTLCTKEAQQCTFRGGEGAPRGQDRHMAQILDAGAGKPETTVSLMKPVSGACEPEQLFFRFDQSGSGQKMTSFFEKLQTRWGDTQGGVLHMIGDDCDDTFWVSRNTGNERIRLRLRRADQGTVWAPVSGSHAAGAPLTTVDAQIVHSRPRGRPPAGKTWCEITGHWLDVEAGAVALIDHAHRPHVVDQRDSGDDATEADKGGENVSEEVDAQNMGHKRPRGRSPGGKTWCSATGSWVSEGEPDERGEEGGERGSEELDASFREALLRQLATHELRVSAVVYAISEGRELLYVARERIVGPLRQLGIKNPDERLQESKFKKSRSLVHNGQAGTNAALALTPAGFKIIEEAMDFDTDSNKRAVALLKSFSGCHGTQTEEEVSDDESHQDATPPAKKACRSAPEPEENVTSPNNENQEAVYATTVTSSTASTAQPELAERVIASLAPILTTNEQRVGVAVFALAEGKSDTWVAREDIMAVLSGVGISKPGEKLQPGRMSSWQTLVHNGYNGLNAHVQLTKGGLDSIKTLLKPAYSDGNLEDVIVALRGTAAAHRDSTATRDCVVTKIKSIFTTLEQTIAACLYHLGDGKDRMGIVREDVSIALKALDMTLPDPPGCDRWTDGPNIQSDDETVEPGRMWLTASGVEWVRSLTGETDIELVMQSLSKIVQQQFQDERTACTPPQAAARNTIVEAAPSSASTTPASTQTGAAPSPAEQRADSVAGLAKAAKDAIDEVSSTIQTLRNRLEDMKRAYPTDVPLQDIKADWVQAVTSFFNDHGRPPNGSESDDIVTKVKQDYLMKQTIGNVTQQQIQHMLDRLNESTAVPDLVKVTELVAHFTASECD